MPRFRLFAGLLAAFALGHAGNAQADFVDNFSTAVGGFNSTGTIDANFHTGVGLFVDVVKPGYFSYVPGTSIDLSATAPNATTGTLISTAFGPGTYAISFTLSNNIQGTNSNTAFVTFDGFSYTHTFAAGDTAPITVTALVSTTVATTMTFAEQANDPDFSGVLVLAASVQTVPEPASIAMLGLGGAGLMVIRRRRRLFQ